MQYRRIALPSKAPVLSGDVFLISGPGMSPCSYNCLVTCFSGKSRIFVPQVNDRGGVLWFGGGGQKMHFLHVTSCSCTVRYFCRMFYDECLCVK